VNGRAEKDITLARFEHVLFIGAITFVPAASPHDIDSLLRANAVQLYLHSKGLKTGDGRP
jgi:hypothetical protein